MSKSQSATQRVVLADACSAGAQLAQSVEQQQDAAANGIGTDGRPVVTRVEDFGMKLAHQFPWNPAAAVAIGLALRRRFLSDPDSPSTVSRRLQVTKVRRNGLV
jgi:hypothetical protein